MELRNCAECGKVFVYIAKRLCPECRETEEKDFRWLREYLNGHRGADLNEVHEATGVAVERILRFLREGRLVETGVQWKILVCESCGEPITAGKFCVKCTRELARELQNTVRGLGAEDLVPGQPKVYIKERLDKKNR